MAINNTISTDYTKEEIREIENSKKFQDLAKVGLGIIEKLQAANAWPEDLYKQFESMIMEYGISALGTKHMFVDELKALTIRYGARQTKNNDAVPMHKVYAWYMYERGINVDALTDVYNPKNLTASQIERIRKNKDRIAIKVNASEKGFEPIKRAAKNGARQEYSHYIDPAIAAAINTASRPDTVYSFKAVVSSLKEEGLSVEMQDGLAHVFVEAEGNRVDAGIIRPGSIIADLTELDKKCLSLGKGINLSIVINKAGGSNPENNESAAEAAKEEDVMTEEEILYDRIRYLLEDNLAEVEKRGQNVIITGDTGHMAILITGTMIEFGRVLYSRCGEIFNEEHTAAIRKGLEELFGNDKAKQETPQTETVKTVLTEAEEDLVSKGTSATVDITFDVELPDGRLVKVTRRTSVKQDDKDPNFLYGYIYRDGKYVGSWIWNRKYSLPVYKPQQAMKKTALGERNSRRLCVAIKKAVCGK
jgi:hypothetical protein